MNTAELKLSFYRFCVVMKNLRYALDRWFFGRTIPIDNEKIKETGVLVSVVIPCFNYGAFVEEAILSVSRQTLKAFEVIVVDGGSTDPKTIEILHAIDQPNVRVVFREGRHLVGDNRNFGIALARGRYICCLDADDKLQPTYLEKAVFFAETGHFDLVFPWVRCFGNKGEAWEPIDADFWTCTKGATLPTVTLFRRSAWEAVGGYRDWGMGDAHVPEDWDFWVRLLGNGFRAMMIPEHLMLYRVHGTGLTAENRMPFKAQMEKIRAANLELFTSAARRKRRELRRKIYQVKTPYINLTREPAGRVKLLLALPFMVTGGADEVMLRIIRHLTDNGFSVTCITTLPTNSSVSGDNSPRYERITSDVFHLASFLTDKDEKRAFVEYLIETRHIDVIFIVGCSLIYQMLPQIKTKYPRVRIVDQLFNPFGHIINNRRHARQIDLNIVANDGIEKVLVGKFSEKKEKVRVIIHGVDVHGEFSPGACLGPLQYPAEWKRRPDDFVVGFFGRFSREKCPGRFVNIVAGLKQLDGVTWLMTGGGPEVGRVRDQIARYDLAEAILLPGIVPDVKPYLTAAHVVVIPSLIEGIPIVLLEAMSLGIPVVASRVGGIPDVIIDGHNGFLCDSGDIDSFCARIKELYEDRQLWKTMSENARDFAVSHLDIQKMLDAYQSEFERVVKPIAGCDS